MDEEIANWFAREILPHEAALSRFIHHTWHSRHEVADLRQEVYVKVLEAAERVRPVSPKAFLFATARNLLIDRGRRNRIVPIDLLQDVDSLNVLIDEVSPERVASGLQQLLRLTEAFERLPDRCREVVWMRKIQDMSQREIAERLGITEATVEAHLVRGMRFLTHYFYGGEASDEEFESGGKDRQHESKHGP
jgi:RNA polymerase sigma factor (sigma-70 family)